MKIKHQNSLILATISALNSTVLGKGIKATHNIKLKSGVYDSQLEFSRKDNETINPIDFFMLGYYIGRGFDK